MPAEFIEFNEIKSAYGAGYDYEVADALKIIADNGSTITQAASNTSYLGNGSAFNVNSITSAVVAGATTVTSAGYAIGALEVTTAGAMLIPALGLGAGALLYNLAPEFWTNVSNKLVDAGKTIGGKVACFFNEAGQTLLDAAVIDVFKDELIDGGYYASGELTLPDSLKNNLYYSYLQFDINIYELPLNYQTTQISNGRNYNWASTGGNNDLAWFILEYIDNPDNGGGFQRTRVIFSKSTYENTNNVQVDPPVVITRAGSTATTVSALKNHLPINDGSGRYVKYDNNSNSLTFSTYSVDGINVSRARPATPGVLTRIIADIIYTFIYGTKSGTSYIEDGAILPSKDTSIVDTFHDSIHMENIPTDDPDRFIQAVPIEIPELNPGTTQEKALDPDNGEDAVEDDNTDIVGPIIRWIKDNIVLPNPSPDPDPDPTPQPDPDPDPQPEPDPLPEPDPVEDETDPIDPNPDPPTPDPPILPVLPSTVSSNKLFTVYNPTLSQLNSLGAFLWSNDIIDALKKIWQDPLEGVISLRQVFCSPVTGNTSNIILGTLDSGVSSLVVTEQFVTQECGTISLQEFFRNVTDYSPYTQLHLYLPFIGIVEINVNEFMNGSISITYHFDVYTGAVLTEVKCTRSNDMPSPTILYTFTGNASQALPITATNYQGAINATIGVATGALTLASGGGINPIFAMANMAHSVTHEMVHVNHASSLSGNAGIMGSRYPQLIVSRRKSFDANAYNDFYGYPTNKTVYLSNCYGYTRVKAIHFASVATQDEKNEIENLLKEGVIL